MRIKALLGSIIILSAIAFSACDDDIQTVGGSIRPGDDDIYFNVDTVIITAKTLPLNDHVYAQTYNGLIGDYTETMFGSLKSDYMCQLYNPPIDDLTEMPAFKDNVIAIDSVNIKLLTDSYMGDEEILMGLSAYRVNTALQKNFYTDVKGSNFCDLSQPIAQGALVYKDAPIIQEIEDKQNKVTYYFKDITLKGDTLIGKDFVQEWKTNPATFKDEDSFNNFFKGLYITPTFGRGGLVSISHTSFNIHYRYRGRNYDNTKDSIRSETFVRSVYRGAIQMNCVENQIPSPILATDPNHSYIKSPAGVYTELTIPIGEIIQKINKDKASDEKKDRIINSATFMLKGDTKVEETINHLERPNALLLVPSDSLHIYFEEGFIDNNKTSFLMSRNKTNNSYEFASVNNNISRLVSYYMEKYKGQDPTTIPDLKYAVLPISAKTMEGGSGNVSVSLYNLMKPTSAVFKTDTKNMQMSIIFSKFKERY